MEERNARPEAEPRRHHYVPKCWLAGFTKTGESDGRLWVTDLSRQKQWPSTPEKTGRIRDFYRFSEETSDPLIAEKMYGVVEGSTAPILKALDTERRAPNDDELDALLQFIAFQWSRVPKFRPFVLGILDSMARKEIAASLETPEKWVASLRRAGLSPDAPGAGYEEFKKFHESGEYNLVAENEWYVDRALKAVDDIVPLLRERHWGTSFSENGRFIASDSPVAMEGPRGEKVGFKNAEFVFYPVSRHVHLTGTMVKVHKPRFNLSFIAGLNTMMLLTADAQVYSHVPDFSWADEHRQHQTDWRLFSKSNF